MRRARPLDPAREAELAPLLSAHNARIDAAMAKWSAALAPYAGRPVIAYHNAFPYLARRFRLDVIATVEEREGVSPGPARLAKIAALAKERRAGLLLVEAGDPGQLTPTLTRAAELTPVALPTNGEATGDGDYVALMEVIVTRLAEAFAKAGT
jgi:ABC-type Zn uptake system ZnuABC Zn-binding protein ZnuA